MPNHVTNVVQAHDIRDLAPLLNDAGQVDFRHLIPEPPNIEQGGCSGQHAPGVICWYEWNVANWGTKWNAYESSVEHDGTVTFLTAWSHPEPVIFALSKARPEAVFRVRYASEDIGHNCDEYLIRNGKLLQAAPGFPSIRPDNQVDWRDFAAELVYGMSYAELQDSWQ